MVSKRCACGGANRNCPQCGGTGVIDSPGVRPIMSGPAGIRRRLPVARVNVEPRPTIGPPVPKRCPHCGFDVLDFAAHLAESHPDQLQEETAAEREAREQEEARLARVAEEIARREAEAAQRKAEARARRQALEGLEPVVARPEPAQDGVPSTTPRQPSAPGGASPVATPPASPVSRRGADVHPSGSVGAQPPASEEAPKPPSPTPRLVDETWERLRRAQAERAILSGVIRSCKPFGVFVDLGGIDGLVRSRELVTGGGGGAPPLQAGQTVRVVVIGLNEGARRVELSMRRAYFPPASRGDVTRSEPPRPESPMALAFRLAQEKKQQGK